MTDSQAGGLRVPTVFLGSGSFGIPSLRVLAGHGDIDLRAIVTAPPAPVGRRQTATPTPIEEEARGLGLAVLAPRRLRAADAIGAVFDLGPALAVLADYGQIVPAPILALPHGALNLHASLLPRHRGATPIQAAIAAGDEETGVTLFRMDEGLDTGPIVASSARPIEPSVDAPTLAATLADAAAELLARTLPPWLRGAIVAVPQPSDGATITRPLRREDGRLDPTRPAADLDRLVRAYRPWPGTWIDTATGRIAVRATHLAASGEADTPGLFVRQGDEPALATADGRLVLDEVQPAGGRPMTGAAFLRGRPTIVGSGD